MRAEMQKTPHAGGALGEIVWRALQDSNLRPPGS